MQAIMNEGWNGHQYLVLFADEEIQAVSERYGIATMLPEYQIIGLRGWDDFIVQNRRGNLFTVPTVPCDSKHLVPDPHRAAADELTPDDRFRNKLKWYIKPIAFGGSPSLNENLTWVTYEEHAALVKWWNAQYRALTPSIGSHK
jgi:hypothetical protein